MRTTILAAVAAALAGAALSAVLAVPGAALADQPAQCRNFGPAGLLSGFNKQKLQPITLSAGKPIAKGPITLKSGTYYELPIVSDGTEELALGGADFFRAIWINEIAFDDSAVSPLALDHISFEDKGKAVLKFVAIRPGRYELKIPGTTGATQRVEVTIQ